MSNPLNPPEQVPNWPKPSVLKTLTLTLGLFHGWFKTGHAGTGSYRNHPLPISVTVKLQWHRHLQGVGDTSSWCDHQWGCFSPRRCFGEHSKVCDRGGALLIKHSHWDERHASTKVLEGQVKPSFGQRTKTSDFRVYSSRFEHGKALVRGNGVHLHVRVLHPERAGGCGWIWVRLVVEEIKCFFAGTWDVGDAVAVTYCEFHLHVYTQYVFSWDEVAT